MTRIPPRMRIALGFVLAGVVLVLGLAVLLIEPRSQSRASDGGWAGALRPPGLRAPEFRLRDQDGKIVDMAGLRGQPVVMTFLYTHCKDTCPLTAQQIRGALDDLGGRPAPVVAISVDPRRDTPASARAFVGRQHLAGRMRFVLGTREQLQPVWRGYGIQPQQPRTEHTAYVVLVDRRGVQRIGFPTDKLTPESLAHDLRALLRGAPSERGAGA